MKRTLLIISIVSICHVIYSQDTIVRPRVVTNTEQIVDKYIDRVGDVIATLASQLKVPAEHVYGVLTKQGFIKGISSLCALVLSLFMFAFAWNAYNINYIKHPHDDQGGYIAFIVVSIIMVIISGVCFCAFGLSRIINPEYFAIKELLRMIQ